MTSLIDHAVDRLRALPPEEQEDMARAVLQIMGEEQPAYQLTPDEEADLVEADAEIARGDIAAAEQVRAVWAKHGL